MKTIPSSYVKAAKSMGATNWTAFWRIYFLRPFLGLEPGVFWFILAISFYNTCTNRRSGRNYDFQFYRLSQRKTLNWSLAAAMGGVLLVLVLFLYWIYDRVVGIDNMKLG